MEILQKAILCAIKECLDIELRAESADFARDLDSADSAKNGARDSAKIADSADFTKNHTKIAESALKSSDFADFASKISLGEMEFIIAPNKALLEYFAESFLDFALDSADSAVDSALDSAPDSALDSADSAPDKSTLSDIAKEIANLIVGKAKVLFEEQGQILKLGIPQFLENAEIPAGCDIFAYKYEKMKIVIYQIKGRKNGRK
ncbi:hypothetical protein [Helicobacter sp. 23-1045]